VEAKSAPPGSSNPPWGRPDRPGLRRSHPGPGRGASV